MDEDREEERRRKAYELWEREGRPDGRHLVHWLETETADVQVIEEQPVSPEVPHTVSPAAKSLSKEASVPKTSRKPASMSNGSGVRRNGAGSTPGE